jgi:hypothetical protein
MTSMYWRGMGVEVDAIHGRVHDHGVNRVQPQCVVDECVGEWQRVCGHAGDRNRWAGYMSEWQEG